MDTSQYMDMFLGESMDNLQILNEALLQLEQEPSNMDKVNEIFRVAHTLKGMSATMGFTQITSLTHKMEDVLAEFRNGELVVTQDVVTVLFKCLDTLDLMLKNIEDGIEEVVDIDEIVNELENISNVHVEKSSSTVENKSIEEKKENEKKEEESQNVNSSLNMNLNEFDIDVIKQAEYSGHNAFMIKIVISSGTLLKSARAFLIFKSLDEFGEVIKSDPCTEDIEAENFEFEIKIVFITSKDLDYVKHTLENISEVEEVDIELVEAKDMVTKEPIKEEKKEDKKEEKAKQSEPIKNKEISTPKQKAKTQSTPAVKKSHQAVRVDLERLDKFMNMVSELVIHRTRLEQIAANHKLMDLNETLEQVARATSDLQDLVMKIRMLPLETVFSRFPRMIRDLSVELGKEMELIIEGADTELDRTVIEEIGEPLIHLIRNAAGHGIESPEERKANGKDPVGKIKLIAYQEGTKAVIKVQDDGGGIKVEKIKEKCEKKGIDIAGKTDLEIMNIIFMQGFSTNDAVNDLSGRGVGMDVVKTKIESLGGTVEVMSELHKGSSFVIKLPLTLQIIKALLVKVGDETMAISLGYIDRVLDYQTKLIKKSNNKEVIIYNGNVIPLIRVNERLNISESDTKKKYIVVVKVGEKTVGLLVDTLIGQQEIVIKPLGKTLQSMKEYIGATILGDGLVTLILDVASII